VELYEIGSMQKVRIYEVRQSQMSLHETSHTFPNPGAVSSNLAGGIYFSVTQASLVGTFLVAHLWILDLHPGQLSN